MKKDVKLDMTLWSSLTHYTRVLDITVRTWKRFLVQEFSNDYFTRKDVEAWIDRVGDTFSALSDLYLYDTLRRLTLFPVASGLPERIHLSVLESKLEKAQEKEQLTEAKLKRAFLDHLFKEGHANCWLLESIAKSRVLANAQTLDPVKEFAIRKLRQIEGDEPLFVCCFERYCYRHIPSLYLVLFTYTGEEDLADVIGKEMANVFREGTSHMPKLGQFAMEVDGAHVHIHPQWVGRISLGPLFVSHMTQDDHELQQVLNQLHVEEKHQHASRIVFEYVMSDGSKPVKRLFDPKGRRHSAIQTFAINELDSECSERQVSHVEKHLFVSHRVAQILSDEFKTQSNHVIQLHEEV